MKTTNAIILAGGKGTRLKSVIQDIPKPMASIGNAELESKPFLEIILDHLYNYGFKRIVLSVGYKWEIIQEHFKEEYRGMQIEYAIEKTPLGTGGAIKAAAQKFREEPFFVFNGDTLFRADLWEMEKTYLTTRPDMVIGLKPMQDFSRYGTVQINKEHKITAFNEKKYCEKGLINGGVYLLDNNFIEKNNLPEKFSFEKDVLENLVSSSNFVAVISDSYFIDIGIKEDYIKASKELSPIKMEDLLGKIKSGNWTLFLDRDGVINERIPGNYIKHPEEFAFIKGSDTACVIFTKLFKKIVVVTNQQGVGKNLMKAKWMDEVHDFMVKGIEAVGGKIDQIYYCPELAKNNPKCRKPNIGMGLQAAKDFPEIDFSKSIMVGDSISDIQFGNRLGMMTVFVETKTAEEVELAKKEDINFQFRNLSDFAETLR